MPSIKRLQHLQQVLADNGLDAAALIPGPGFFYLTGAVHHVMERPIVLFVPREGRPAIVIPDLEADFFASKGFDADHFRWADADGYEGAFAGALAHLELLDGRIGIEGQNLRFFEAEAIRRNAPDAALTDAQDLISSIRLCKEPEEIEALRRAIHISEQALENTVTWLRAGMTEREVASYLIDQMSELGGQGLSFEPLVLGGDNSSRPHGKIRDDVPLKAGDSLIFDFGTVIDGYPADITRTFFIEEAGEPERAMYATVLHANTVGRETARPGLACGDLDEFVTQTLLDAGYGEFILHRTGHGLGLDVHEGPWITRGNEAPLEPGMVFTIEPGLYKPDLLGIRIEDNVVITADGLESLTSFPRELRIIG
ncbi:MAG: aminopeptidase P family protein [Anaerolineae bacterium]|nr:aminopeptidase P family protein [Anaerolineae bacterium]